MSCPKLDYSDSAFNLRFDADALSGIAGGSALIRDVAKGATPQLSGLVTVFHQVIVSAPETHRRYDWLS